MINKLTLDKTVKYLPAGFPNVPAGHGVGTLTPATQ